MRFDSNACDGISIQQVIVTAVTASRPASQPASQPDNYVGFLESITASSAQKKQCNSHE